MHEAQEETQRVRNIYGLGGLNRYRLTFIGATGKNVEDGGTCHLLRIDDPDEYVINEVYYDRNGTRTIGDMIPLVAQDLEFAVWCNWQGEFRFESLKGSQNLSVMSFRLRKGEVVGYYPYSHVEREVTEGPFLVYIFCSREVRETTNMQQIALDEEKLKAWCIEHDATSICFEFQRMDK